MSEENINETEENLQELNPALRSGLDAAGRLTGHAHNLADRAVALAKANPAAAAAVGGVAAVGAAALAAKKLRDRKKAKKEEIQHLIRAASNKNPTQVKDLLNPIMADMLTDMLATKKIEVARDFIGERE